MARPQLGRGTAPTPGGSLSCVDIVRRAESGRITNRDIDRLHRPDPDSSRGTERERIDQEVEDTPLTDYQILERTENQRAKRGARSLREIRRDVFGHQDREGSQ